MPGKLCTFVRVSRYGEQFAISGEIGIEALGIRIERLVGLRASIEEGLEKLAPDATANQKAGMTISGDSPMVFQGNQTQPESRHNYCQDLCHLKGFKLSSDFVRRQVGPLSNGIQIIICDNISVLEDEPKMVFGQAPIWEILQGCELCIFALH